ncbi:ABC transporter substrate-binding protein [Puerhibacterium sp. TATVAM-FAB25]|uniref:ABC transporter substrate-binding protein n=1 Tax=Puerhibacterium sp. TATVAM-FAB25 TaxID=3093699 RepID=UPI00397A591E
MRRSHYKARPASRASVALVATAAVLALTSCSSSGAGGEDDGANGEVTVQWWSWNPDEGSAGQYIEAFEKAHPNITVEHRFLQYTEYTNALRLSVTSDSGPDVFGLQVGALTHAYAPLTEDLAPYAQEEFGADWADRLLTTDQLQVDGKQVGMPWTITAGGLLWYDKTLFDSLGLEPPTTLEEWKRVCATVQEQGIACLAHGAKDAWVNIDLYQTILNQVQPGALYDALDGTASFTDEPFVTAMKAYQELFTAGIVQEGATGISEYPDASDMFRRGEAATIALGTWENNTMTKTVLTRLSEELDDPDVGERVFLPVPFPLVAGEHPEPGLFGGPDVGWAMSARSDAKDAAWTFISWMTSQEEGQQLLANATLQSAALKTVEIDASDVVTPEQEEALQWESKALQNLVGPRQIPNADVEQALGQALSAVAAGTSEPAAALSDVQTVLESTR